MSAKDDPKTTTTVEVQHDGKTYTVQRYTDPDDLPGDVIDAMESDKASVLLQAVLGPEQWAAFKRTKPTLRDYKAVAKAWVGAQGLGDDAGE